MGKSRDDNIRRSKEEPALGNIPSRGERRESLTLPEHIRIRRMIWVLIWGSLSLTWSEKSL